MWQPKMSPHQTSHLESQEVRDSCLLAKPRPPMVGSTLSPGPAVLAWAAPCHRTCVHTKAPIQSTLWLRRVFPPLWKASMRVLGDLSPCLPVESQV